MADEIIYKKVTDLTEKSEMADTDLTMVGHEGTAEFRKISWNNIANSLKAKFCTWLFDGLKTNDKTLIGAVNEIKNSMAQDFHILTGNKKLIYARLETDGTFYLTPFETIETGELIRCCLTYI